MLQFNSHRNKSWAARLSQQAKPALAALALLFASPAIGAAAQFESIFTFNSNAKGRDPSGQLLIDAGGRLYGTTERGGLVCPDESYECGGTVYRLTPPRAAGGLWQHNTLHSFGGGAGGATPRGGLVWTRGGVLAGTTTYGGVITCAYEPRDWGCGTIFRLLPPRRGQTRWRKQVLHRFDGEEDGRFPESPLGSKSDGSLFGTTSDGGGRSNLGTAFTVAAIAVNAALYEIIVTFIGKDRGGDPREMDQCEGTWACFPAPGGAPDRQAEGSAAATAGLVGNLFGVATTGGSSDCVFTAQGCGTIYRLLPPIRSGTPWRYSVLHSFLGGSNGAFPFFGVTIGPDGSLYGTTSQGGTLCPNNPERGCGVIYRLVPPSRPQGTWAMRILHRFQGNQDGAIPIGRLSLDPQGAVYGATREGGGCLQRTGGCGTVFKLMPPARPARPWRPVVLHRFQDPLGRPDGSVLLAPDGKVYGVAGRSEFRITP